MAGPTEDVAVATEVKNGGGLSVLAGGVLLSNPVLGGMFLAILLFVYLLVDGVAKVILSFQLKPLSGWGWTLFSGIVT